MKKFTILSLLLSVLVICGCQPSECIWEKDRTARPPMVYCADTLSLHELFNNYFNLSEGDTVMVTGYIDSYIYEKDDARTIVRTPPDNDWLYMAYIHDYPVCSKNHYTYDQLNGQIIGLIITTPLSESDKEKWKNSKCTLRGSINFNHKQIRDACIEDIFIRQIDSIHIEQERP